MNNEHPLGGETELVIASLKTWYIKQLFYFTMIFLEDFPLFENGQSDVKVNKDKSILKEKKQRFYFFNHWWETIN